MMKTHLGGLVVAAVLALGLAPAAAQTSKQTPTFKAAKVTGAATAFPGNGTGIEVQFGPNGEMSARPGGLPQFDAIRAMVTVDGTQGVGQVSAIAGTVRGKVSAAGSTNNNGFPVGIFGNATCEVNGCNVWSMNLTATDSGLTGGDRSEPGAAGRVIQNEFDMNVWNPTTLAKGLSVVLNAFTPGVTSTFGFIVEKNAMSPPWAGGFVTSSGAARDALVAGEAAKSGTNVPSQPIVFNYFNGAGVNGSARLSVIPTTAGVRLTQTGGDGFQTPNLFLPSGGQFQFSNATAGGTPVTALVTDGSNRLTLGLNANQTLLASQMVPNASGTQAVGTPSSPFGTVAANAFYAGSTQGVTCAGAPTANFAVTNGIVTRC